MSQVIKILVASLLLFLGLAQAAVADWQKVVAPADLKALLRQNVVVVDIRPAKAFAAGRIQGALNAPYALWRGPADNPGRTLSDAALTKLMRSLGLTSESRVVVAYPGKSATGFGAAARVYWTLKSAGLRNIAILNGGMAAWAREKLPVSVRTRRVVPSTEEFSLAQTWMIDRDGVQAVLDGNRAALMIDARPPDFFQGRKKHKAASKPGTLDGALNITHSSFFQGARSEILTGPEVLAVAKAAGYEPGKTELVSFCNTGHWAATNWFALSELAGINGVKLYPESMVGWTLFGGRVVPGG